MNYGRSKITNGKQLLANIDGRSAPARRFRDLVDGLSAELGGFKSLGLFDQTSIKNAAGMTLRLEQLQSAMARGDVAVSADELIRLSRTITRIMGGLHGRRAKPPEHKSQPGDLRAYLDAKGGSA